MADLTNTCVWYVPVDVLFRKEWDTMSENYHQNCFTDVRTYVLKMTKPNSLAVIIAHVQAFWVTNSVVCMYYTGLLTWRCISGVSAEE